MLRALVYDEWEWLAEKDREHDLKYLTDLLIAGFEEPHTFTGFFSQELAFSSLNHEQLVYDLIGRVVTGNLDVEGAAFLFPLFVEEWEKLYNELQTLSHANRFMGRDPTDRLEEATRFRMITYSYFVALLQVLSEKPPTKWNAPVLQTEPSVDVWIGLKKIARGVLPATPATEGRESAPSDLDLQLSTVAPLVEELLAPLSPEAHVVLASTRRFTETFAKAQECIVFAESLRA